MSVPRRSRRVNHFVFETCLSDNRQLSALRDAVATHQRRDQPAATWTVPEDTHVYMARELVMRHRVEDIDRDVVFAL